MGSCRTHRAKEPQLLDEPGLDKRAIKVVSPLLASLPRQHSYRIIFMRRPVAEIACSQAKMIARRGTEGLREEEAAIAAKLTAHLDTTLHFLRSLPEVFEILEVSFPALIASPANAIKRLTKFLHPELLRIQSGLQLRSAPTFIGTAAKNRFQISLRDIPAGNLRGGA